MQPFTTKLDQAPKNLVEVSFLIIYTPFLLASITIDIPGTRGWSKVAKWYWRFSPVSLIKIDLQKTNLHQMNHWKVYFLAYFIINIPKVNMVGPRDSNVLTKTYGGFCNVWNPKAHFSLPCQFCSIWQIGCASYTANFFMVNFIDFDYVINPTITPLWFW